MHDAFMSFVANESRTTDIFCFQEIYSSKAEFPKLENGKVWNIFEELSTALPDFEGTFCPAQDGIGWEGNIPEKVSLGNASFVRKGKPIESSFIFLCGSRNSMVPGDVTTIPTGFQYLRMESNGTPLTICNTYGNPRPGTKLDTPERIKQSEKLLKFIAGEKGQVVICGDLNLLPGTESIKMLSGKLHNLIDAYGIQTTRSKINATKYPEKEIQHFADYAFVSPNIKVRHFSVPQIEVSDHLPMILEF